MSDEEALLAAIIANPDEDTPRLVFADWLDENGQPDRAEFIRLQIERASTPGLVNEVRQRLLTRETTLLSRYRKEWLRPFQKLLQPKTCKFQRGFVDYVEAEASFYLRSAAELYRMTPVRELLLHNASALVALSRSERPKGTRLRLGLGGFSRFHPRSKLDLLEFAPAGLEPWLATGEWLLLVSADRTDRDRSTVTRLWGSVATRAWPLAVGIRPYDEASEFASWCREVSNPGGTVWIRLSNARCVWSQLGPEVPKEFRGLFWD